MNIFFFHRFSKAGREGKRVFVTIKARVYLYNFFFNKISLLGENDHRMGYQMWATYFIDGGHISSSLYASTEEMEHPILILGKGISGGWLQVFGCPLIPAILWEEKWLIWWQSLGRETHSAASASAGLFFSFPNSLSTLSFASSWIPPLEDCGCCVLSVTEKVSLMSEPDRNLS